MAHIEIDGIKLEAEPGSMLIEAADSAGIHIPRFCYHKKLSVAANCRLCLVEMENARGAVPACATPVTEGMKVFTKTTTARLAQKSVMEFLLINHPLDCPICDQGGECELQDMAVGYGNDVSRFCEGKRVVKDKNIGPLIATFMTRCIHCTRCVRFGTEVAGIRELGATGRGEHMQIGTYIENSVDSEMSGNIIDLCPVGALTSKPFQFQARAWELKQHPSLAPHDCVVSNIDIHTRQNKLMRVVPHENEQVNECWISDRDRFSYLSVYSEQRLTSPKVKQNGQWVDVDWQTALNFAVEAIEKVTAAHGAENMAAICSPSCTTEEMYLLQKLVRGLGSPWIEHRIHHRDFSVNAEPEFPRLGTAISEIESIEVALIIGSHLRKQQPIINTRLHKAVTHFDAKVTFLNPLSRVQTFKATELVCNPDDYFAALWQFALLWQQHTGCALPELGFTPQTVLFAQEDLQALVQQFSDASQAVVWLGSECLTHPQLSDIRLLAQWIAKHTGAQYGELGYGANTVGAYMAGALPHRLAGGHLNRAHRPTNLWNLGRKVYILMGIEPDLDLMQSKRMRQQLADADLVIALTGFKNSWLNEFAHLQLPMASFAENEGSYINCAGDWQSFSAAITPVHESKPAWKVLRVLGNLFNQAGFDYQSVQEVTEEIRQIEAEPFDKSADWALLKTKPHLDNGLSLYVEWPIYQVDAWVRRAGALQQTKDGQAYAVTVHPSVAVAYELKASERVEISLGTQSLVAPLIISEQIAPQCILIPMGFAACAELDIESTSMALRQVKG